MKRMLFILIAVLLCMSVFAACEDFDVDDKGDESKIYYSDDGTGIQEESSEDKNRGEETGGQETDGEETTGSHVKFNGDKYSIVLTVYKNDIVVDDAYAEYMQAVDDGLLHKADKNLWSKIPTPNDGYYCFLGIDSEGYLCIYAEVIVHIENDPNEIDHEHLFFVERITKAPVK